MAVGNLEVNPFWLDVLRTLKHRGLAGVKLVISDAYEGLKAAVIRVLRDTWQRCRVHFALTALAHADKTPRRIDSASIGTAYVQEDAAAPHAQWRTVADQLRPEVPKLAGLMDAPENVLAYMHFRPRTAPSCLPPTPSNTSTARSSAAQMSSAYSPTRPPSCVSSAPSCSSRPKNGPGSAPAT
jgi:transposase-like protein